MTWWKLRRHQVILLLVALAAALLLLLPMRLAAAWLDLADKGVSARAVQGSIWSSTFREMRIGALPIGTVDASLSPLSLLVGRVRLDLERHANSAGPLAGALLLSRGAMGIDHLSGALPAAGLFAPLPVEQIALEDVSVRFANGRCVQAEGRVRADIASAWPGLALAQGLSGRVSCAGRRAQVALTGQTGRERITLSVGPDGGYAADAMVAAPDPALGAMLDAAGFKQVAGGYRLRIAGRGQ